MDTTSEFIAQHEKIITRLNDMELSMLDEIVHNEIIKRKIKEVKRNERV